MRFGGTRDRRILALLRLGLKSANPMVAGPSADALVSMNDLQSIPFVLRLIETSNKSLATALTIFLTLYDAGLDKEQQIRGLLMDLKLREMYRWSLETKHKREAK